MSIKDVIGGVLARQGTATGVTVSLIGEKSSLGISSFKVSTNVVDIIISNSSFDGKAS